MKCKSDDDVPSGPDPSIKSEGDEGGGDDEGEPSRLGRGAVRVQNVGKCSEGLNRTPALRRDRTFWIGRWGSSFCAMGAPPQSDGHVS